MHDFGYDRLPTVAQTHLIFGAVNLGLTALAFAQVRRVQFFAPGGNGDG